MHGNVESIEKAYSTGEIAVKLDMGVTTVRKYAQHLEKAGYEFIKTKNHARLFVDKDIETIQRMKEIRENPNVTVEQATYMVMGKKDKVKKETPTYSNIVQLTKEQNKDYGEFEEIKELINNQNELISSLIEKIDQQQIIINEWLNERDKDLIRTITERLETQKLIAAATEEEPIKQSFLNKFFKK